MIRARLVMARDLADGELLPPGFNVVWSRPVGIDSVELVVDGPFDPSLPDGAEVSSQITALPLPTPHLEWQWRVGSADCGAPIDMPWITP